MTELAFNANHIARVTAMASGPTPFFQESARRLYERLEDTKRTFNRVLNLSVDHGASAPLLPAPAEEAPYDLIFANLALTIMDDPVTTLHQHVRTLSADGLLLASTLGAESFREFRQAFHAAGLDANGRITPLPDVQECGTLLQRLKLALPVVDRDLITLTFDDFPSLYRNLRAHHSHNWHPARHQGLLTPRQLAAMGKAYRQLNPRPDDRLPLTLELIYLHGWQPAASQQQPLKPGDGKVSLVKILNPAEV